MSLSTSDWTKLDEVLDRKLEQKLAPLVDKISHLPTKEQFYKKMDKWMKATSTHDLEKSAHKLAHEQLKSYLAHSPIL